MRVTEQMIQDSALRHLQSQLEGLAHINAHIASGKRVSRPADDPVAAGEILDLQSNLAELEAYEQTTEFSHAWVTASDNALRDLADLVTRARTIALRGSNAATYESIASELADEAEKVLQQAVTIANSRHKDDYLFAGSKSDTAPFDLDIGALTVTYQGDSEAVKREIEPGQELQINVPGDTLEGVLSEMADLVDSLRNGDASAVASHLDSLDTALETTTSRLSEMGLAANQIDAGQTRLASVRLETQAELSQLEETDMAEAAVELHARERGYQATLAAVARGTRQSLMNYLR